MLSKFIFGSAPRAAEPILSPFVYQSKRWITFAKGTEGLKKSPDPTIRKLIAEIDAADKAQGKETVVVKGGTMSHNDPTNRMVFLPAGHDDPVQASHELQHARDFAKLDVLPGQEILEKRAFHAQKQTADFLRLDDQLGGMTPGQRAKTHSQVKK